MKIVNGNTTVEDIMDKLVETKDSITCGCKSPKLKMLMHIDGDDFYQYNYKCDCGNEICVSAKREVSMW